MSTAIDVPTTTEPVTSAKPRVFQPTFSGPGVAVAAWFFALSLLPSLLPRGGAIQGVASAITLMIGYGIGASGQAIWNYLGIPTLKGRAKSIVLGIIYAIIAINVVVGVWSQVGWQNEIRTTFGMEPVSPATWPTILIVAVLFSALILIVSRSLRLLFRFVGRQLGRFLPAKVGIALGAIALIIVFWLLISGVLVNGFFSLANAMFSSRDGSTASGIVQTESALRSGGPGSLVEWDELGRQGRNFVGSGPTVEDLNEFSGGGALEPIRVYVGLKSAETVQERADLVLEELKRTGAFDREALIVATTTGTGFLDANGITPPEYIFNGDIAIAGVQYSYLPSWISLLADQDAVKETSQVVFNTVHDYWSTLPEETRPDLYLYGLSLGSFGVESVLNSINILNEPISGAVMTGPPFVNQLHGQLTNDREPGSTAWLPIYGDGRTVRFAVEGENTYAMEGDWGPTRLVYLQHGSDPIVFFNWDLAFSSPDWLQEGQRAPDVSPKMGWYPLVTLWQVALDLPGAGGVPDGYGHMYSKKANTEAWVAVTQPEGWTPEKTAELVNLLEAQGAVPD